MKSLRTDAQRSGRLARRFTSELGAEMVEYALGVALLIGAFIILGVMIRQGASNRGIEAGQSLESMAPCPAGVSKSDPRCL